MYFFHLLHLSWAQIFSLLECRVSNYVTSHQHFVGWGYCSVVVSTPYLGGPGFIPETSFLDWVFIFLADAWIVPKKSLIRFLACPYQFMIQIHPVIQQCITFAVGNESLNTAREFFFCVQLRCSLGTRTPHSMLSRVSVLMGCTWPVAPVMNVPTYGTHRVQRNQ